VTGVNALRSKVFVVLDAENQGGCGTSVAGVFTDEKRAALALDSCSDMGWIETAELDERPWGS
jgi:hypothetical protein